MRTKSVLLVFAMYLYGNCGISQRIPLQYEVAIWQGFRSAAISYTFDDLTPKQLTTVVPLFNEYGFQLTLFPVINWSPNWSALQSVVAQGHEVGSHTVTHTSLSSLSDQEQDIELQQSQQILNEKLPLQKCLTIAYPYCALGKDAVVRKYYIAGRICSGVIERKTPLNMMQVSSIICGSQGSIKSSAEFKTKADAAAISNGWCVYLLHGVDNDGGYSPIASDTLRKSLEYLRENPNKFWVTSFGTVAKYIYERNCVSIRETYTSDDTIVLVVSDTLDNYLYNIPLTIRRVLPMGWQGGKAFLNGRELPTQIVDSGTGKYIVFDVIPDQGELIVCRTEVTNSTDGIMNLANGFTLFQNYPNPFNPSTKIRYRVPVQSIVEIKVFNMLGKEIATVVQCEHAPGTYEVEFNSRDYPSGVYVYTLKSKYTVLSKKFILIK
ncbi:MAG: polysaccharide deacetylase family protein [Bacteroidetes bacterium]|nr:polysaccharide deacetylase family protein [Bacteroidota bacterium]